MTLPSIEEFDTAWASDDNDHHIVQWASDADALSECSLGGERIVDPDALAEALFEHWHPSQHAVFKQASDLAAAIVHSGVEVGDYFGDSDLCAYHANAMAKG